MSDKKRGVPQSRVRKAFGVAGTLRAVHRRLGMSPPTEQQIASWEARAASPSIKRKKRKTDPPPEPEYTRADLQEEAGAAAASARRSLLNSKSPIGNHVLTMDQEFFAIDSAWWRWVNENCPHKSQKTRGRWMSSNEFSYDGATWKRSMSAHRSNTGKNIVARSITYTSSDGRVLTNGEWKPNRRSDPARNWGLPD